MADAAADGALGERSTSDRRILSDAMHGAGGGAGGGGQADVAQTETETETQTQTQTQAGVDEQDIDDVIAFLSHEDVSIQLHALRLVQGLTVEQQVVHHLGGKAPTLVPGLLQHVPKDRSLSRLALTSLVNISQEPRVLDHLLEIKMCNRAMDYLREKTCPGSEDLLIMLLANITADERGAEQLLQIGQGAREGLHLAYLLGSFLSASQSDAGMHCSTDPFEHVASILPNATVFKAGRKVVLEPGRGALQALASQLDSANRLRRTGCAGAIKNCFFCCEEDGTEGDIADEEDALNVILGLLCGTGADKRKAEEDVRELLAEGIYCLAKSDVVRTKLWRMNAVDLLKKGYEDEENVTVCEALEGCAEFFLQDGFEKGDVEGGTERSEDGDGEDGAAGDGDKEDGGAAGDQATDACRELKQRCVIEEL